MSTGPSLLIIIFKSSISLLIFLLNLLIPEKEVLIFLHWGSGFIYFTLFHIFTYIVAVQLVSHIWFFATPWTIAHQTPLSSTISQSLFKFMSIESLMLSNHFNFCHPLLLLPSIFPSITVLSNELALPMRRPEYWSFSNRPSLEYSGLISFRIDWFDLLTVPLKSLLQHHCSKALILQHSAFFMVELSHLYITIGKNHSFDYMDLCWQSDASAF